MVAVVRLHGVAGWTAQWVAMVAKGFSPGHVNSALPSADYSHLLLNLQAFVLLFTSSESVATAIAFAVTGAGLILALWWRRAGAAILLQALAALTLLPAYHRYYDGTILLFAIPSTAIMWREGERRLAALNGALLFLLAFPFTAMLKVACAAYHVPPNAIVQLSLHLQPVVVAAIAATAVAALRRERVAG